jgi:hypothetical protein
MYVRRCLTLFLPALLVLAALGTFAVAAPRAVAGGATGAVSDRYDNFLEGIVVEALDAVSGVPVTQTSTDVDGTYSLVVDSTPSGSYRIRVSDPTGFFTTTYVWDALSFDEAYVFGCT